MDVQVGRHFRRNLRDVLKRISSKWRRQAPGAYSAAVSMQMMERRMSRQPRLDESVAPARDRRERSPSPRVRLAGEQAKNQQQQEQNHQLHQHRFVPNAHNAQRAARGVHFPGSLPLGAQLPVRPASSPELDDGDGTPATHVETLFNPLTPDPSSYAPPDEQPAAAEELMPVAAEQKLLDPMEPIVHTNCSTLSQSNGHL